jgi:hypothetical protein
MQSVPIITDVVGSNKTDRHDITEILLKVALNTIKTKSNQPTNMTSRSLIIAWLSESKSGLLYTLNLGCSFIKVYNIPYLHVLFHIS